MTAVVWPALNPKYFVRHLGWELDQDDDRAQASVHGGRACVDRSTSLPVV